MSLRVNSRLLAGTAMIAAFAAFSTGALAQNVAIVTPYLAQPGTQAYVEGFQAEAKAQGWHVNVVDTAGDVAAAISAIEDAVNSNVDAIVINVNPEQVGAGLEDAKSAGIPVVGMDAGSSPLLATNVTSNGYAMAATTATYVVNRLFGTGRVVMFVYDAFPPVQNRTVIADAVFGNYPDIEVVDRITPDVQGRRHCGLPGQDGSRPGRQSQARQYFGGLGRVGPAGDRGHAGHRERRT